MCRFFISQIDNHYIFLYNFEHEKNNILNLYRAGLRICTGRMWCKIRITARPRLSTQLPGILILWGYGETGRRAGFRFQWGNP